MKKTLSILLTLALLLSAALFVSAETPIVVIDGLKYEIHTDVPIAVVCGPADRNIKGASYRIPATINCGGTEYPVTAIRANAFADASCDSVLVPESVTSFGENAFTGVLSVTFASPVPAEGLNASHLNSSVIVVVPDGAKTAYVARLGSNVAFLFEASALANMLNMPPLEVGVWMYGSGEPDLAAGNSGLRLSPDSDFEHYEDTGSLGAVLSVGSTEILAVMAGLAVGFLAAAIVFRKKITGASE